MLLLLFCIVNYNNASMFKRLRGIYWRHYVIPEVLYILPLRVLDVLRHHMHTRIIRVAGCVTFLPPYLIHAHMRDAIPLVHAARRVTHITFAIIILSKCWSVEQRKNMQSNRRTQDARGWTTQAYIRGCFFRWPYWGIVGHESFRGL